MGGRSRDEGDGSDRRAGDPFELQGQTDEQELVLSAGGKLLELEVLHDVNPGLVDEHHVARQGTELRVHRVGDIEGDVVRATEVRLARCQPAAGSGAHAGTGEVLFGVAIPAGVAGADENAVALAHRDAVSLLRQLEVIRGDQVVRLEGVDAACASDVEKNAAAEDRCDGLRADLGEPAGGLNVRRHADSTEHLHLDGLVAERVDVGPGVLLHRDRARCTGADALTELLVVSVERVYEARPVRREHRGADIPGVFQLESAATREGI